MQAISTGVYNVTTNLSSQLNQAQVPYSNLLAWKAWRATCSPCQGSAPAEMRTVNALAPHWACTSTSATRSPPIHSGRGAACPGAGLVGAVVSLVAATA